MVPSFAYSASGFFHYFGQLLQRSDGTGETQKSIINIKHYLKVLSILLPIIFNMICLFYRYVPEGNMTACGTDYLSKDMLSRSYILFYSIFVYFLPLFLIIYSYFFIIQAVAAHEKNMREQAKKMNVASLRSAENQSTSTECKLAKARVLPLLPQTHPFSFTRSL